MPLIRQEGYNSIAAVSAEDELTNLKQSILDGVNQYRSTKNLPPLSLNSAISQQAKTHSKNMAQGQVSFSHEGFKGRVQALSGKISYRRAAENLAYNSGYAKPAKQAVDGWIDSPSHRHNMLGNYNLTGIGIAKNSQGEYYFTQIFILEK
ncbi:CAP domain-containing protein [Myxosarcina sp. GI1]|uniref:CAP domain-containing protein n=1 Tax=Myxosarcina sp. GI1 TaxID=1541065 RepID=UPI000A48973D|nr:CAP domain-containing protein [Myxosarcina sp. GI1]